MNDSPLPLLTKGEWNCLLGVARHLDSAQIADQLGYTAGTVDVYLSSARRKLRANNRRHALHKLQSDFPEAFNQLKVQIGQFEPEPPPVFVDVLRRLPWPWPTRRSPTNDRSTTDRLIAFLIAAILLMAIAAAYLGLVVALSDRV